MGGSLVVSHRMVGDYTHTRLQIVPRLERSQLRGWDDHVSCACAYQRYKYISHVHTYTSTRVCKIKLRKRLCEPRSHGWSRLDFGKSKTTERTRKICHILIKIKLLFKIILIKIWYTAHFLHFFLAKIYV